MPHRPVPREISIMFARAMAGVDGQTTCTTPDGHVARLERNPTPEVLVRVRVEEPQGVEPYPLTAFAASAERPSGYPSDLPFLRDRSVTLAVGGGQRILAWMNVWDAQPLLEEVTHHCSADGWEAGAVERQFFGSRAVMRKGIWERVLLSMWLPPVVELLERRLETHD